MALYLDPSKNAYVDPETGAIIPLAVVLGEDDSNSGNYRQTPNPSYSSSGTYVSVPTAYASPYITNHRDSTSAPSPTSPTSAGILSLLLLLFIIIIIIIIIIS